MKRTHPRTGALAALYLVAGTVACTAAVPTPSAPVATEVGAPTPSPHPTPTASTPEPSGPAGPLGREITIKTIDPAPAPFVGTFASDSQSIWFAAGRDSDTSASYAPDLWRYVPGTERPQLVWKNPGANRVIGVIAGDIGTLAFGEMDGDGARDWNLWLIPAEDAEPILLDSHPGDEDVSSFLPSVTVSEGVVAWTAFDRGPAGSVSQLVVAQPPDWTPRVLAERDAAVAELWLPSVRGIELVYTEVTYNADRTRDERHVYLTQIVGDAEPRRLDESGLATMPLLVDNGVIWKETDPGFNMFNWGHLVFWDRSTEKTRSLMSRLQPDLNYPSAGSRFVAVFAYDTGVFEVYDLVRMRWRLIDRYDVAAGEGAYRAHVAGDLIAWVETRAETGEALQLRWAYLPIAGEDKLLGS